MTEKIKITFLGTADSVPSAKRNHPAFLLTYQGENILVDCGEGTQRQLRKARINPGKITRILITHWHADHVLGLPGLLQTLALSGYHKKLFVYGPRGTKRQFSLLLRLFAIHEKFKIEVREVSGEFLDAGDFYLAAESMSHGTPCNAYSFVKKGKLRIDKSKLKKFRIDGGAHLQNLKSGKSISYKGKRYGHKQLTYKEDGKKISFVLDTALNKKIIPFVKNSDILVCESSFGHELKEKAREHKHLTVKQTAEIAKKARVKRLFLIHISQRYEKKFPEILKSAKKTFKNSIIPKDLDSVEI